MWKTTIPTQSARFYNSLVDFFMIVGTYGYYETIIFEVHLNRGGDAIGSGEGIYARPP
ncbi:hypothetical protein [Mannheimia indoligenes]|uniref:hypothetical protein n=1 Tax=Mannheimia indoligenes TaxID=3103145 RepID=UPI002FE63907